MRQTLIAVVIFLIASQSIAKDITTVPTNGEWEVGYDAYSLEARLDDFTKKENDYRKVLVEVWYPAEMPNEMPKAWASEAMGKALSEGFPFPEGFEKDIAAHAWVKANPVKGKFPVVVFSHGLSFPITLYQSFTEDLASRGYIVLAINHPHGALFIEYPDGSTLDMTAQPRFNDEDQRQEFLAQLAQIWTTDVDAVLDSMTSHKNPLAKQIDKTKVAIVGHSLGGTTAGLLSQDKRIKAVVAMEGDVRISSAENFRGTLSVGAPLLHLIGGYNRVELDTGDYLPSKNAPVYTVVVNGTGHAYFSDLIHFYRFYSDMDWRTRHRYELDPDRVIRISTDYIAAFLDHYVQGKESNVLLKPTGYAARTEGPTTAGYTEVDLSIAVK